MHLRLPSIKRAPIVVDDDDDVICCFCCHAAIVVPGYALRKKTHGLLIHVCTLPPCSKGIAECFMIPYNCKVWATHPKDMNYKWIGERVAMTDLKKVLSCMVKKEVQGNWGPNSTFRYPVRLP